MNMLFIHVGGYTTCVTYTQQPPSAILKNLIRLFP